MIDEKEKRRKARIEAIYKKARKQKELSKLREKALEWSEGTAARGSEGQPEEKRK